MAHPVNIDDNTFLICPECGDNYLHHTSITVYNRTEDAPATRVTHLGTGMDGWPDNAPQDDTLTSATVPSDSCDNPSSRRHGLQVRFYCETCDSTPTLNLAQHKGYTELVWK
jgi:hypothetical protein